MANDYPACASTLTTGDAAVSGTLIVRQLSLYFEAEELRLDIPFLDLRIDLDPEDTSRVIFTHPNFPGMECYTYSTEILHHPTLARRSNLKHRVAELTYTHEGPSRHTKMVFSVLGGIVALLFLLALANNFILAQIVKGLPVSWEKDIGAEVMDEVWQEWDQLHDPLYTNYLQAAAQRLIASLPRDQTYHLYVADSPVDNAFAIPGGHIVVLKGLIDTVESPEELAGVLAHEIAHLRQRHSMREIAAAAGPMLITKYIIGSRSGVLAALAVTSAYVGQQRYSRDNEREADDLGFDYLLDARINPAGMVRFFERLEKLEGIALPDILSSHPATSERLAHLRRRLAESTRGRTFQPLPQPVKPEPGPSQGLFDF